MLAYNPPLSLSRYCGRNPPVLSLKWKEACRPPPGAYCSLAGLPDTISLSLSLVTAYSIIASPPCLASLSLPLQNLKSVRNIYIPSMDFLGSGHAGRGGALRPPQGVSGRPRRRHLGRHLGSERHHCHPNARWRHTLGWKGLSSSSSSYWALVSPTLR